MQVWKNSLKKYKIGAYNHNERKYYLSLQINSLDRHYSFSYKTDEDVFKVKGQEYALTEENRKILLNKIAEFKNEWSNAFQDYENILVNGCSDIYIKKLNKTRYHVFWLEDEKLISFKGHMLVFLAEFLARFYKWYSYTTKKEDIHKEIYDKVIADFLPLKDQYVIKLAKYITNNANKEDVDYINEYENGDYLFVDREVYGIEDITDIRNVKLNRFGSMFGWRISYELECKIENRYYKMKYFPSNIEKVLHANCPQVKIKISDNLLDKIKGLTGETDENRRTRRLMQLGNFLYETKKYLSNEQMQKVFTDFSKVSLQDLQSLPKRWLDRIDDARLYDWLKCSGLQGDKDVSDYVEDIIKNRKGNVKENES